MKEINPEYSLEGDLDYKESWAPKNWCFWTVVLEKILESPLDCKEIQPVHPKGDQSWVFIGGTDVEAETTILWPPDGRSWLIGKDPDAGKDRGQEEKGTTEDEMVGWHHRLNGHGFGCTPGVGDGQGGLECCGSWGRKESDTTERLNWTELMLNLKCQYFGHLMWRADSLEEILKLGKTEGRRKRGKQKMRWLDSITDSMDMSLHKLQRTGEPGVLQSMGSQKVRHNQTTTACLYLCLVLGTRLEILTQGLKELTSQQGEWACPQSHTTMWTAAGGMWWASWRVSTGEIHHVPDHKSELRCKAAKLREAESAQNMQILAEEWGLESVGGKQPLKGFKPQSGVWSDFLSFFF